MQKFLVFTLGFVFSFGICRAGLADIQCDLSRSSVFSNIHFETSGAQTKKVSIVLKNGGGYSGSCEDVVGRGSPYFAAVCTVAAGTQESYSIAVYELVSTGRNPNALQGEYQIQGLNDGQPHHGYFTCTRH